MKNMNQTLPDIRQLTDEQALAYATGAHEARMRIIEGQPIKLPDVLSDIILNVPDDLAKHTQNYIQGFQSLANQQENRE